MRNLLVIAAVAAIVVPTVAWGADRIDVYPLDTCAVAAKSKLGGMGDPVIVKHEGREVRFCCEKCEKKLADNPEQILAALDERIIAQQKPSYPLTTCPVSGEELDDTAVDFVVNNQLVRTCCKMCMRKVIAKPEAVLAKVDAALIAAQLDKYPLTTCPVSGEELGSMGEPVDVLVGHRLVRLCCKSCKKGITKDPVAALAAVEAGWAGKTGKKTKETKETKEKGEKGADGAKKGE